LVPSLDAGHAVEERLASLGEAAVDLRVGPAGLLADLLVRVALRAQEQAADLLRLQAADGLGAESQSLVALGLRMSRGHDAGGQLPVARQLGPLALLADGEG